MFRLDNKTAVITGGGSGIGKAIALLFAKQGAMVHLLDLNADAAKDTVTQINNEKGIAFSWACDVTDQLNVKEVMEKIAPFQLLVNSAGIVHIGKADNTNEEDFDKVIRVNVKGVYNCIHAAIPHLRKAGGGSIINLASIAAHTGLADRFVYSASKGAVMAMTMSVAKDYLADHIRCNSISPARVHTALVDGYLEKNYPGKEKEMFEKLSATQPIGRMGTPEEVAALALYLCSDEAGFLTGCDYPIDGGFIKLNT
jgi:NAD(P)-dependent dehydrogenase (short-subunit alcohol dehydrogenase family)